MLKRMVQLALLLGLVGVLAVAALLTALTVERSSDAELPAPTGPLAVGRAIYHWRDQRHEVLAWVWYPAAWNPRAAVEDYMPPQMLALYRPAAAPIRWVSRDLTRIRPHSISDGRLPRGATYPVLILRAGGSSPVVGYTVLAEDLASHGFVVVGIDVPTLTSQVVFPDGRSVQRTDENDLELYSAEETPRVATRLLTIWTSHMSFALDRLAELNANDPSGRFTGRLDLTRVGVFGHSFGGAQAAQFCHDDARCAAAIDIDGIPFGSVIADGMPKPFMFLMEGVPKPTASPNAEVRALYTAMRSIYAHLPPSTRLSLSILGANHFMFADDGTVRWSRILLKALRASGVLKIDGRRQVAITTYAVHGFFDAYLKQKSISPLNLLAPQYPELQVLDIQ